MAGIRAIIRDAPAGQLARLYLGLKISPYVDEQEAFQVHQPHVSEEQTSEPDVAHDLEKGDESDKDIENNAADEAAPTQPKADSTNVGWSSPTDIDNPQNWSTSKKCLVFAQICLLTFAS
jgi:DHA1 family multidrug resistance protein-like MFS transporter